VLRLRRFISALLIFEETLWQLQDSERQVDELLHRTVKLETINAELTGRYTVAQAHIGWLSDQLAAERAECERLRSEVFGQPRVPSDEQLEAGLWP